MGVAGLETVSLQMEDGTGCVAPSSVELSGPNRTHKRQNESKGTVSSHHLIRFSHAGETSQLRCHLKCII